MGALLKTENLPPPTLIFIVFSSASLFFPLMHHWFLEADGKRGVAEGEKGREDDPFSQGSHSKCMRSPEKPRASSKHFASPREGE